jgi:hypothetical protein
MAALAWYSSRVLDTSELQDALLMVSSAALTASSSTDITVRDKTIYTNERKVGRSVHKLTQIDSLAARCSILKHYGFEPHLTFGPLLITHMAAPHYITVDQHLKMLTR